MKTIILAGGLGTRLSEETELRPKPMVEIGGKPIIWHIMNLYARQGHSEFIIATGYKADFIESWIYQLKEPWNVKAIYTGENTQTGGRIRKVFSQISDDQVFITYGDGLGNINLLKLLNLHQSMDVIATVTAVRPPARFGVLEISSNLVDHFGEKNQADAGWINGGFFLVDRRVLNYIKNDSDPFESTTLPQLASEKKLAANLHTGFWKPMDTLREKKELDQLAKSLNPPWSFLD